MAVNAARDSAKVTLCGERTVESFSSSADSRRPLAKLAAAALGERGALGAVISPVRFELMTNSQNSAHENLNVRRDRFGGYHSALLRPEPFAFVKHGFR